MAVLYKTTKYDTAVDPDSLTEQEHLKDCDINLMVKKMSQGLEIRGSNKPQLYGYDDTTLDGVQFRIQKQKLEAELNSASKNTELTEEELALIPDSVKKKFPFRKKSPPKKDETSSNEVPTKGTQNTSNQTTSTTQQTAEISQNEQKQT